MTYSELSKWIKLNKRLDEQVIIALIEEDEPDEIIPEYGPVWYAPFIASTLKRHECFKRGKPWPEKNLSHLHIELWEDEANHIPEELYTWRNLLVWIESLEDKDIVAEALGGQHKFSLVGNGNLLMGVKV